MISCQSKENIVKKNRNGLFAALAIGVLATGLLSACEKKEGPAERAGKQVDKAFDSAGKQVEKAGEKIQDTAKDAKK
jgi:hypothetical protein